MVLWVLSFSHQKNYCDLIFQQCLQDQMQNNAPVIVMMTTTTTTTTTVEGQRQKRDEFLTAKGDTGTSNLTSE